MACARHARAFVLQEASSCNFVSRGSWARKRQLKKGSRDLPLVCWANLPSKAYEASKACVIQRCANPHSASHSNVSKLYSERDTLGSSFFACPAAATVGSRVPFAGLLIFPAVFPLKFGPRTALFRCATLNSACASCDAEIAINDNSQSKNLRMRASYGQGSLLLLTIKKTTYDCTGEPFDRVAASTRKTTLDDGCGFAKRERTQSLSGRQRLHDASTCRNLYKNNVRLLRFSLGGPSPSLISALCFSPLRSPICVFVRASSSGISYSTPPLPSFLKSLLFPSSPLLLSFTPNSQFVSFSLKSHFSRYALSSLSPLSFTTLFSVPCIRIAVRFKMVKSASYHRPPRASPTGQARKPHIGPRRLSAEYVTPGVVLVKQRKFVAFNLETKRRRRHFKMYPGENVGVTSSTHLVSLAHGRVKYTHDVTRDVFIVNVLPERKEELLREDLWRYRTEHVRTVEENRHICFLRMKATRVFPKELVNPPTKPELRPYHFTKRDIWENPTLPDVPIFDDDR